MRKPKSGGLAFYFHQFATRKRHLFVLKLQKYCTKNDLFCTFTVIKVAKRRVRIGYCSEKVD
jgi:hypothetical protein